ncbi:MAG: hypothetical protein U9N54_03015 [candidate division Zixibacteria bacterium]|nr:hypothetical protein [candidate division Zixibacteria bacterium]
MNIKNNNLLKKMYKKIILPLFFLFPFLFIYIINEVTILNSYLNLSAFLLVWILHYLIFSLFNRRLIIPYRFNLEGNDIHEIEYYFNSGKSWLYSSVLVFLLVIVSLSISKPENIEVVKYSMSIGFYSMIYGIYGFVFNVALESIAVRDSIEKQEIFKNNLKTVLLFSFVNLILINVLLMLFMQFSNINIDIIDIIYKSDFWNSFILLLIPKIILLFFVSFAGSIILIKVVAPVLFEYKSVFINILFISLLLFSTIIAIENILIYLHNYTINDSFIQLIFVLDFLILICLILFTAESLRRKG